jgi:AcrR family transcriptional regulator
MKRPGYTLERQQRGEVTRARLIQSAEKIFARDGFEAAKLEEIASDAGYTRGAFYANFASKEDLFFALLEREVSSRIEIARNQLDKAGAPRDMLETLRKYFLQKSLDRRWSLLSLEFKLLAVRHPEVKTRLAAINRRFISFWVDRLEDTVKAVDHSLIASAPAVGMALSSVSTSLTVEHMLDRNLMSEEDAEEILANFFDCMTGRHASRHKVRK